MAGELNTGPLDERMEELRAELIRIERPREQLLAEIARCELEKDPIAKAENPCSPLDEPTFHEPPTAVDGHSFPEQKIRLFRSLFRGREYLPVSYHVIEAHFRGHAAGEPTGKDYTIGVYPMLPDETCWFLAVDFDTNPRRRS